MKLHQHVPGMPVRQGWRTSCRDALKSTAMSASSSKLVNRPRPRSARSTAASAAAGDFSPTKAVSTARLWKLQGRRGDNAERALGADEQVAQVVAGVVLLQLRQAVENAASASATSSPSAISRARHRPAPRPPTLVEGCADGAAALRPATGNSRSTSAARCASGRRACLAGHGGGRCRSFCPSAASRRQLRHYAGSGRRPAGIAACGTSAILCSLASLQMAGLPRSSPAATPAATAVKQVVSSVT